MPRNTTGWATSLPCCNLPTAVSVTDCGSKQPIPLQQKQCKEQGEERAGHVLRFVDQAGTQLAADLGSIDSSS